MTGLVFPGITHCKYHPYTPIDDNFRCKDCEEEKRKAESERKASIDEINDFFLKMNKYEWEAFKEFIKENGKKYEKEQIKKQIEKLNKRLEE